MPPRRRVLGAMLACAALVLLLPALATAAAPRASTLSRGWEIRDEPAAPGDPQQPPPEETAPDGQQPAAPPTPQARSAQSLRWRPVQVPNVFDVRALPRLYPGVVRRYRLRFRGPRTPRGFRWLINFESVRRSAKVYLNGRLIGRNSDPYTPFTVEARGLRPRRANRLVVVVDNRKNPRLQEGWWNWGGIVRSVRLVPAGTAHLSGLGVMSRVRCRRPARSCKASLLLDGTLVRRNRGPIRPTLSVRLRSPAGQVIRRTFRFARQRSRQRRVRVSLRVPGPKLWSPERPRLYSARLVLRNHGRVQQVIRETPGLRSVRVRRGRIYLNGRPLQMRGASIHEDMPGHGAALTRRDMSRIVRDLQEVGANVTRAHYLMNERLLDKFDRAGILVWNQAPIWQRDHRGSLLRRPAQRRRAYLTVRRTVRSARSHPSVITHSVANELSFTPDARPTTRRFLIGAANYTRALDPTLPVSVDIKGRPGFPEQFTYSRFDILGINQYFGWYSWVRDFSLLEPYLQEMRDLYPGRALVMTEFGAEARPDLANAPPDRKGGYAFQAFHTDRTLDVVDRSRFLSGAIYWTMREFEIYPGWTGGAGRRPGPLRNTRHNKGLLTYGGQRKPAWYVAREHFTGVPLYRP